jgi:hypothetical protein
MARDSVTTERLGKLVKQLTELTTENKIHWERQVASAHRYARWNNHLLILGPDDPTAGVARYLFITPFDSPACIEINSDDPDLGSLVLELTATVEATSQDEPPTDPFALTEDILSRLGE